jgi:uncharacterized membrane protein
MKRAVDQPSSTREGKLYVILILILGVWVWLPFLAPMLMHWGWETPAKGIYFIYSFFCHQLPQRSLFLYGNKLSYSLIEIQNAWVNTSNPLLLKKFIGTAEMGWKVAWSDRMVALYNGIWVFSFVMKAFSHRFRKLPFLGLMVFLAPLAVDGITHFISDLSGIGQGFRDTNLWLRQISHELFPAGFYAGDGLGSFNSWVRWISGLVAAFGFVWFVYSMLDLINQKEE